jgi:predicted alpha-1,2-mannosidase
MKVIETLFTLFVLYNILFGCQSQKSKEPVDYVDPFIGTSSSRWMQFPGPAMPFGMVKLSPDNTDDWLMDAGYEDSIKSICGFGHIHSWMMGSFLMMPSTGELQIQPGKYDDPDGGYRSRVEPGSAEASAGYYSVVLEDYKIKAELTSTTRCGFQRYTFPESSSARIIFDLQVPEEGKPEIIKAAVNKVNNTEITGYIHRIDGWNDYTLHFIARFSKPFQSMGGWKGNEIVEKADSIFISKDLDIGAFINFKTSENEIIVIKTGISFVSIDQARLNLETELDQYGWDFDAVHQNARSVWNSMLSKIKVEGGSETDKLKFYTNMYHSYCARSIFSDVNGKYIDACEKVKQVSDPANPVFGCDAFWMTFWNLNQLWSLVTPDIASKWAKSELQLYDDGGWLNKGPGGLEYSGIMVAEHEIPLISNAYLKGIRDFDIEKAYRAMKEIQTRQGHPHPCGGYAGNSNLSSYMRMGYVPSDEGPVSNTLEYAFDDWCVAQLAKTLGKEEDYLYFMNRSQNYRNVFDPSTRYVRPKYEGGPWYEEFNPNVSAVGKEDNFGTKDYVEANAWQYSWFAPHDIKGLIGLIGKEEFNRRLENGFEKSLPFFTCNYINHSNQPNMQAAWLFNYSGKPWLTQKWVREILDRYYGTGPLNGYQGDEDEGQMGAWFVMSAMGLFEMDGGSGTNPSYEIASPLFEKITITLDSLYYSGKEFVIKSKNFSAKNRYIQSVSLNGEKINKFWFSHSELVKGGELQLEMGPEPNKEWAADCDHPQVNNSDNFITTPYITETKKIFIDQVNVTLACDTRGAKIFFTLNGRDPDINSTLYTKPFIIDRSTTLKMIAYKGEFKSLPSTATLVKATLSKPLKPGEIDPGLVYRYYLGAFRMVNDFKNLQPDRTGKIPYFSINPRDREQYFAFDFSGYIKIPADGIYTFYLTTNDGGRLYIDEALLINNDGLHPAAERYEQIPLKAGLHSISVQYFQEGGTNFFKVNWAGPDIEKGEISADHLFHRK